MKKLTAVLKAIFEFIKNFKNKLVNTGFYPFLVTTVVLVILGQYQFTKLEAIFYDFWIKHDFGISFQDNIVLVTLDEESDEHLGERFPYAYASHHRFLKRILEDRPAILTYLFSPLDPKSDTDRKNMMSFKKGIEEMKKKGGVFRFGHGYDEWGEDLPPTELRELGHSLALINTDESIFTKDEVSRRAIIDVNGESSFHLWVANAYRELNGLKPLAPRDILGSYYVENSEANFVLFRYYCSPISDNTRMKSIPFHRVLVGNFPKGFFHNKIVLVGPRYHKNSANFLQTPYEKTRPSASTLKVHAQIVQSFIQNKTIWELPKEVATVLSFVIAIVLSLVISRSNPANGLMLTITLLFGIIVFSYVIFSIMGIWFYLSHILFSIFVVYYIWVPFRAMAEYQRRYAIQEEAKLLKQVENLKQNFISLMSHDLKTPVAKVAGLADLALQTFQAGGTGEKMREHLNGIIKATKELNSFISSILDLTKIESRKLEINRSSKDINPIIEDVVQNLRYESSRKKVELETDLSPLYPICMDPVLIRRVISNLIENGLKYSGEGRAVKVRSWDDDQWVYITIEDNGAGIPEDDLKHIFDKFYRVKNDASHSVKGTGLGLYLVKYFIELHQGEIKVESKLGQGTSFTIKLKNAPC